MARRKGSRRRRARGYARKASHTVGKAGSKMLGMLGIGKGGLHVGRCITGSSILVAPFVPVSSGNSAVSYLLQKNVPYDKKAINALTALGWVFLGYNNEVVSGKPMYSGTKGICGMGVLSGIGISLAGKLANPMISGSYVKL